MFAFTALWGPALPPFLLAAAVCICAVPLSMILARRLGAMAHPDEDRHLHPEPTPRLGGIAMFLGFTAAMVAFGSSISERWQVVAVCAAITITMAIDDVLDLSAWTKLVLEMGAAIGVAASGILITFVALPTTGGTPHIIELATWVAVPITVVWVMGMQISINFLDGSDGVAAGVVGIVAMVSMLAAVNRLDVAHDTQSGVIVMAGALMGCCLGFLVFNLPPARVFMGDTGAHFLGVALAIITIVGVAKIAVGLSLAVPLIALGLPIGDTAFAIVRRRRAGLSPAQADAGHLHHRLLARGMTPMETALTFYLMTAILGCLALAMFGHRRILDIALVLLVVALVLVWRRNHGRRDDGDSMEEGAIEVPGRRVAPEASAREADRD